MHQSHKSMKKRSKRQIMTCRVLSRKLIFSLRQGSPCITNILITFRDEKISFKNHSCGLLLVSKQNVSVIKLSIIKKPVLATMCLRLLYSRCRNVNCNFYSCCFLLKLTADALASFFFSQLQQSWPGNRCS